MPDSNLPQQRVIIIGNGSLFDDGIMQLLAQKLDASPKRTRCKLPNPLM
jgi:hypothetical protein